MAIVFGVTKFHIYLYGRQFIIESDHQPLSYLLKESKQIPSLASSRIQQWALTLSVYRYIIHYKAGKNLSNAYALSRLPSLVTTSLAKLPEDLLYLFHHLKTTSISAADIKQWTAKDPVLSRVLAYVMHGWAAQDRSQDLEPY